VHLNRDPYYLPHIQRNFKKISDQYFKIFDDLLLVPSVVVLWIRIDVLQQDYSDHEIKKAELNSTVIIFGKQLGASV
jgi:hypothetical protein